MMEIMIDMRLRSLEAKVEQLESALKTLQKTIDMALEKKKEKEIDDVSESI